MSQLGTALKVLGVLAGVVLAGVLVGWLASGGGGYGGLAFTPSPAKSPSELPVALGSSESKPPPSPLPAVSSATATPGGGGLANWEGRVEEILASGVARTNKAAILLEIFPTLPPEGQAEVAQHLSNLVPDRDYTSLGQYLTNSATPQPVLDVLMSGLSERPNYVKLPWLLEVAQDEGNSKSSQARNMLRIVLDEDNGKDWAKWRARIGQWLSDNPD